jgi:hypothetical protein
VPEVHKFKIDMPDYDLSILKNLNVLIPVPSKLFADSHILQTNPWTVRDFKLSGIVLPHLASDTSVDKGSDECAESGCAHHDIGYYFPSWRFVVAAFAGLTGISWGWWGLRRELRRDNISTVVFFFGLSLWGYAVYGLLWSLEF